VNGKVGRMPNVTVEQYRRLRAVKAARDALPTDKALAKELGISVSSVRSIMARGLLTYERGRKNGKTT
jgi:transcription initiation factor IIE alpha subunit